MATALREASCQEDRGPLTQCERGGVLQIKLSLCDVGSWRGFYVSCDRVYDDLYLISLFPLPGSLPKVMLSVSDWPIFACQKSV
jgi:hypothetical protein